MRALPALAFCACLVVSASAQGQDPGESPEASARLCMTCHRFNGKGAPFGSDLAALISHTKEALRAQLTNPSGTGVLLATLRNGAAIPVLRRSWTSEYYDLSLESPAPRPETDFQSFAADSGWLHPAEARDIGDDRLNRIIAYLDSNRNPYGEELRFAQQAEAAWEALDRETFVRIAELREKCDGRIGGWIDKVTAAHKTAYDQWKAFDTKVRDMDKSFLDSHRVDLPAIDAEIAAEEIVKTAKQTELDALTRDIDTARQRGVGIGRQREITLKEEIRLSERRIADLREKRVKGAAENKVNESELAEDESRLSDLDEMSRQVIAKYSDRNHAFERRCHEQGRQ